MDTKLEGYVSVYEAAELSGYSVQYLRKLARQNRIPHVRFGRLIIFDREDVMAYTRNAKQSGSGRRGPRANP